MLYIAEKKSFSVYLEGTESELEAFKTKLCQTFGLRENVKVPLKNPYVVWQLESISRRVAPIDVTLYVNSNGEHTLSFKGITMPKLVELAA